MDFLIRLRVSAKVNMATIEQLPVPRLTQGTRHFDALVVRAARLTCTTPEFAALWDEVAAHYPELQRDAETAEAPPTAYGSRITDHASRAQLRAEIDALVADLYGLSEADFAYILTTFPILDRDWPALPGEPKSYITRDTALLALFTLREQEPPADIVPFFAAAGADISGNTGPVRALAERVAQARALGAVAYVPSGRGGVGDNTESDDE
jgi:hypothetical protein